VIIPVTFINKAIHHNITLKVVLNTHKSSQTTKVSGDKNLSKTPEKNKSSGSVHIIHLTVTIEFYMMNTIHTSE
jgi:hypothetical protein